MSAFWNDRRVKGISAQRFRQTLDDIPLLLENFDITISAELSREIHTEPKYREAIAQLKVFKPHDPDLLVAHDAYHKILVEMLRERQLEREPQGWYEASFLFLTFDNTLPIFAARAFERGKGHRVPFCLLGHEWLEILHLASPTTTISSEAFVALLNSPYLESYFFRRALDRDLVREIGITMGELQEYRPKVARRIYANRTIINHIEAISDRRDRRMAIKEAVRREAAQEDIRMEQLLSEKESAIGELESRVIEKDHEIDELNQLLKDEIQIRKKKLESATERREALEKERMELRRQIGALQAEVGTFGALQKDYDNLKERLESLEGTTQEMSSKVAAGNRLLLILPGVLLFYSLAKITSPGPAGAGQLWWGFLAVALFPFIVGIWQRFQGRRWEIVTRTAALVTIGLFIWETFFSETSLIRALSGFLR